MSDQKLTPQEEQQQLDYNIGATASAKFRRVYPEFDASKPKNVETLGNLAKASGEIWSFELLSRLFEEHRLEFELIPEREEPAPAPKPEQIARTEVHPSWWEAVASKDTIDAISREDFRRWMRDPKFVQIVQRVANGGTR